MQDARAVGPVLAAEAPAVRRDALTRREERRLGAVGRRPRTSSSSASGGSAARFDGRRRALAGRARPCGSRRVRCLPAALGARPAPSARRRPARAARAAPRDRRSSAAGAVAQLLAAQLAEHLAHGVERLASPALDARERLPRRRRPSRRTSASSTIAAAAAVPRSGRPRSAHGRAPPPGGLCPRASARAAASARRARRRRGCASARGAGPPDAGAQRQDEEGAGAEQRVGEQQHDHAREDQREPGQRLAAARRAARLKTISSAAGIATPQRV